MGDLKQSEEEELEGEEDQSFLAPTGGCKGPRSKRKASRWVRSPERLATTVTELAFHSLLPLLPHHRESENRGCIRQGKQTVCCEYSVFLQAARLILGYHD
jgi:hypothetical protein